MSLFWNQVWEKLWILAANLKKNMQFVFKLMSKKSFILATSYKNVACLSVTYEKNHMFQKLAAKWISCSRNQVQTNVIFHQWKKMTLLINYKNIWWFIVHKFIWTMHLHHWIQYISCNEFMEYRCCTWKHKMYRL